MSRGIILLAAGVAALAGAVTAVVCRIRRRRFSDGRY